VLNFIEKLEIEEDDRVKIGFIKDDKFEKFKNGDKYNLIMETENIKQKLCGLNHEYEYNF
jgi:hypothetical protein